MMKNEQKINDCKHCGKPVHWNPTLWFLTYCSDECGDAVEGAPTPVRTVSTDDGYDAWRDEHRGAFRSTYQASDYRYGSWDH